MSWRVRVRRGLDRLDNEEVRAARQLARRARRGLDVLYLGESTVEWVAPADNDRRPLHVMLTDRLDGARTFTVHGGSYSAELFDAYLGLTLAVRAPRLVIVPLWYRGRFLPWMQHPVYSRARAAAAIRSVGVDTPPGRIRRSFAPPSPAEWERYRALPFETFAGLETVGAYADRLKDSTFAAADPDGRTKLIYAYHQTHRIDPAGNELDAVRELGRSLRRAGCPVVAYETPVSVITGRRHWGAEFDRVAESNFAYLRDALTAGFGMDLDILRTGTLFPEEEFIDPSSADEHLNEAGRLKLARLLADRVTPLL